MMIKRMRMEAAGPLLNLSEELDRRPSPGREATGGLLGKIS